MVFTPKATFDINALGSGQFRIATGAEAVDIVAANFARIPNPAQVDLLVTETTVDVTDASDAATTIDVGVDQGGDQANDLLIDGANLFAVGITSSLTGTGNASLEPVVWSATAHLVASKSSGLANAEKNCVATVTVRYRQR